VLGIHFSRFQEPVGLGEDMCLFGFGSVKLVRDIAVHIIDVCLQIKIIQQ
jgi:hypothetical protein